MRLPKRKLGQSFCYVRKIIEICEENRLELKGYAYEIGLNEFAISKPEEYVTKFMIKIEE